MLDQISTIDRIRRNHALEHATMHLLGRADPQLRLVGRSDWTGFWVYGKVDTGAVAASAQEALGRLAAGEAALAVHPRCGTNLTAAAILGGLGGFAVGKLLRRWRLLQFTGVLAVTLGALSMGRSVGQAAQRHLTTDAKMAGMRIAGVERGQMGDVVTHHVITLQPTKQTDEQVLDHRQSVTTRITS